MTNNLSYMLLVETVKSRNSW